MVLSVRGITKRFGGLTAVDHVTFDVEPNQVFSVVGPNGSGKTTLFNLISGLLTADEGTVHLGEHCLTGKSPHEIARLGVGRTFQNVYVFKRLTALENVLIARHCRISASFLNAFYRPRWVLDEERENQERCMELLGLVNLSHKYDVEARHLAYGEQKRLEIARALAIDPHILLLDEPAAGLNDREVGQLIETIGKLAERKMTILLIEHKMDMVMNISDRMIVLNHGRKIAEGHPRDISHNRDVIEAYLGKAYQYSKSK